MNIVLINTWRVNGTMGGAERVLFNMANSLCKRGHNVSVITTDNKPGSPLFPIDIDVQYYNCGPKINKNKMLWARIRSSFCLNRRMRRITRNKLELQEQSIHVERVLQNLQADVIVSFQMETTYMLLDHLKVKTPVVTMFHNSPSEYFNKPEFSLYRHALETCACIQVLMPEYVDETLKQLNHQNVVCIANVVPQYDESSSCDSHLIVNVGRVERVQKRQHLIVEAFAKIKDRHPDWIVQIWGCADPNSQYVKEIYQLIDKYKLHDNIKLCGTTSNIAEKLKEASIFLFPSSFEGFSLALTEAMSMGVPAIGCLNCPSVNTLIKHNQNGLLCNDSIDELADCLDKLINDAELRKKLGQQAKKDMECYSSAFIWNQWELLLNSVCKN